MAALRLSSQLSLAGVILAQIGLGPNPAGLGFDGTYLWTGPGDNAVSRVKVSDGSTGAFVVTGTASVFEPAFDGTYIWVGGSDGSLKRLDAASGAMAGSLVGTYPVGAQPWDVAFDGQNIWVTSVGTNSVTRIRPDVQ